MPTYLFKDKETGEETEIFMRISELDPFKEANPNLEQLVNGCPMLHSGAGINGRKPDDSFRDLLKQIHKNNSRGIPKKYGKTLGNDTSINSF